MGYLQDQMKKLKYDARMVNHNIKRGVVSQEEIKKHLDQLPDLTNQALQVDIDDKQKAPASQH